MRALALVCALAGVALADSTDDSARFEAAVALEGRADFVGAATSLRALGESTPADVGADALAEAAQIYESRLYDIENALACWRALVARFPDSRPSMRARARIATLRETLRAVAPNDLAAFATFTRMLDETQPADRARVAKFVREHAQLPIAGRGHEWLGQSAERVGASDEALREYRQAQAAGEPWASRALRAQAELALRRGKLDEAAQAYDALAQRDDAISRLAVSDGSKALREARRMRRLSYAAWAWLALFTIFGVVKAQRLWPPPAEVRFFAPVSVLFVGAAAFQQRAVAATVTMIAAAGVAIVWLAACSRVRPRLLVGSAAAVAVVAAVFLASRQNDIMDLIGETLRTGPER